MSSNANHNALKSVLCRKLAAMSRVFAVTLCLSILTFSAVAQDSVKENHIRELMNMMGSGQLGVQIFNSLTDSYKKTLPDVDPQFWDDMSKEIKAENLINMVVPIYAKYFTDEDIIALTAFYKTPIGQKVIKTMPLIVTESMQIGQEWGKQLSDKIIQRLKEKGYLKST
jgi:hypothetical protein